MEQLELHLGRKAPDDGELDAALLSRKVAARLSERADRPLQVPDDLPVVERGERDVPPTQRVVALEVRLDLADAAEPHLIDAEAPRPYERPGHVLGRIAEVRELPIEHVTETRLGDREVADAQVTVEHDHVASVRHPTLRPGEAELDRRVRLLDAVELALEPREQVARSAGLKKGHAVGRDGMDLRELLGHLRRQHGARTGEFRPLRDAPPDRLARHALADERGPARDLPEVAVRLRDAHAGRERDLEQTVLVLERERLLVDDAAARAPDQELAHPLRRAQVQRPCLLRRSAREEGESLDRDVLAEERDEALAQLDLDGQRRPRRPRDAHNAVCPPSTARICPVM